MHGRLPDGSKGKDHLREVFHRMGMSDRDIVALSGAHTLGTVSLRSKRIRWSVDAQSSKVRQRVFSNLVSLTVDTESVGRRDAIHG